MVNISQEKVETQNSENRRKTFPKLNLTCEACLPSSGKKRNKHQSIVSANHQQLQISANQSAAGDNNPSKPFFPEPN